MDSCAAVSFKFCSLRKQTLFEQRQAPQCCAVAAPFDKAESVSGGDAQAMASLCCLVSTGRRSAGWL